jgi:hypothetical protein
MDFSHPLCLYVHPKSNLTKTNLDDYWGHSTLVMYRCFIHWALSAHLTVCQSVRASPYDYARTQRAPHRMIKRALTAHLFLWLCAQSLLTPHRMNIRTFSAHLVVCVCAHLLHTWPQHYTRTHCTPDHNIIRALTAHLTITLRALTAHLTITLYAHSLHNLPYDNERTQFTHYSSLWMIRKTYINMIKVLNPQYILYSPRIKIKVMMTVVLIFIKMIIIFSILVYLKALLQTFTNLDNLC